MWHLVTWCNGPCLEEAARLTLMLNPTPSAYGTGEKASNLESTVSWKEQHLRIFAQI